tara:strand:- start:350 stop:997 length:648 start_codon:yes stop_codon:yes gene_type:complete
MSICKIEETNKLYNTEYSNILNKHKHIFYELNEKTNDNYLCGSYMISGQDYSYMNDHFIKQELLFNKVKNIKSVLEVGVYMGHSMFIMLMANPYLKITAIDICDNYAKPCIEILNKHFNNNITFLHGNSLNILPTIKEKFDFFHIDAQHENHMVKKEFDLILPLNDDKNYLTCIFDDWLCMEEFSKEILKKYKVVEDIIADNRGDSNRYMKIKIS